MAEPTQNLKFSPDRLKQLLGENMNMLNSTAIELGKKLDKVDKNSEEYSALRGDLKVIENEIERFQVEYTSLQEQEAKPKQDEISKLGEELRQPYVSSPPRGLSPFGLMPGVPDSTVDLNVPTRQEQTERKRDLVAQLYNAPVSKDGMAAEMPSAGVRAGVGALPTPEGELEYLKRTYPNANITPIDIAGQTEYLIKNPDGTSFTTLNKGVAGTAGMLAVEAPLTLLEGGATLGTLAATRSPGTATVAGAGTRAILGPVADSITRMALKMPQEVGESVSRRGMEAGIGMALGLGVDVIPSRVVAVRAPFKSENTFLKEFTESAARRGLSETAIPAGAQFGPLGVSAGQELSGLYTKSQIAGLKLKSQQSLLGQLKDFMSDVPKDPNNFANVAINQKARQDAFAREIANSNNKNVNLVDDTIRDILTPLSKANVDNLGSFFRTTIQSAEDQAVKETTKQYDVLADVGDAAGFNIKAEELLRVLRPIKARINIAGAFDDSAVKGVEKRLMEIVDAPRLIAQAQSRLTKATGANKIKLISEIQRLQSINKPLDFRGFDAYIRAFNDARPDNAVGGSTKDAFGAGVASELSKLRRGIYSQFNATMPDGTIRNLGDEFAIATERVAERAAFEKNTLGTILREAGGEQATTPRAIVSAVMREPGTINRVLQATRQLELDDPAQAGITNKLQGMMRIQYLSDLGMGSKTRVSRLDYDDGIINALYGKDSANMSRSLDSLNDNLRVLRSKNIPELSLTDLNAMSAALGKNDRDKIANEIILRDALKQQERKLVSSFVFKQASKGNFENVDPDLLSKSIINDASIGQTKTTMAKLSQSSLDSRNLFKQDFKRNLLERYPTSETTSGASYDTFFDTKKFLLDYGTPAKPTEFAKKLDIVLGNQDSLALYDIAKLYEAAKIPDVKAKSFQARFMTSGSGVTSVIPIIPVVTTFRNRYLTAMLSTGSDRYGLRAALARSALPGEINDIYTKMFKGLFLTREGMAALSHQASGDPEFSAELKQTAREFAEKEGLDLGAE